MELWVYATVTEEGADKEVLVLAKQPGGFEGDTRTLVIRADKEPEPPGIQVGSRYNVRFDTHGRAFSTECREVDGTTFSFFFEVDLSQIPVPWKPPESPKEVKFESLETPAMKKQIEFAIAHGNRDAIDEQIDRVLQEVMERAQQERVPDSDLRGFRERLLDLVRQISDPRVRSEVMDSVKQKVERVAQELDQRSEPDPPEKPKDTDVTDGDDDPGGGEGDPGGGDETGGEVTEGTTDSLEGQGTSEGSIIETDPETDFGGEPGGSTDIGGGGGGGGGPDINFDEGIPRKKVLEPNPSQPEEDDDK